MSYEVLLLGLLVGYVNHYLHYLPLRLRAGSVRPTKRDVTGILLDAIGIASICALPVVSTMPEVMHGVHQFAPALMGSVISGASFYKTCSIIIPALLSALGYELVWKMLAGLQIKITTLEK